MTLALTRDVAFSRPLPWLFSRRADLTMLGLPVLVTGVAFAAALVLGQDPQGSARGYAGWLTAYALGNTSHVVLTYLLLFARPDLLRATPTQARSVLGASAVVFTLSLVLIRLTAGNVWTEPFFDAVLAIFAAHHTLSQAKGFWALYGLRGARAGLPAPTPRERSLQGNFVPLSLLLFAIRVTLVSRTDTAGAGPYLNVNPGEPALLPFSVTYVLLAAWLVFAGVLLREILAAREGMHVPKLVYLSVQCGVVLFQLVSPSWGITLSAGIHGLEYYLLTRRMLAPTEGDGDTRLTEGLAWPAMIAAMAPILAVGIMLNPFVQTNAPDALRSWARSLVNATVLAHYAADAFLYRFRIPEIRKVALARLRFG